MSRSTFSGPVLAGVDSAFHKEGFDAGASGFNLREGPNWGFVNMVQSVAIEEEALGYRFSGIVIPYKSIITRVSLLVTTAWSASGSGSPYVQIGVGWGAVPAVNGTPPEKDINELSGGIDTSVLGNHDMAPGSTPQVAAIACDTNGNTVLDGMSTTLLRPGMLVRDGDFGTGDDFAADTYISSITSATALVLTRAAITTATTTASFLGTGGLGVDVPSWMNMGSVHGGTDMMIVIDEHYVGGTTGRGVLTVEYCQAVDLSAIA